MKEATGFKLFFYGGIAFLVALALIIFSVVNAAFNLFPSPLS